MARYLRTVENMENSIYQRTRLVAHILEDEDISNHNIW